jgi:hypothetical protein
MPVDISHWVVTGSFRQSGADVSVNVNVGCECGAERKPSAAKLCFCATDHTSHTSTADNKPLAQHTSTAPINTPTYVHAHTLGGLLAHLEGTAEEEELHRQGQKRALELEFEESRTHGHSISLSVSATKSLSTETINTSSTH